MLWKSFVPQGWVVVVAAEQPVGVDRAVGARVDDDVRVVLGAAAEVLAGGHEQLARARCGVVEPDVVVGLVLAEVVADALGVLGPVGLGRGRVERGEPVADRQGVLAQVVGRVAVDQELADAGVARTPAADADLVRLAGDDRDADRAAEVVGAAGIVRVVVVARDQAVVVHRALGAGVDDQVGVVVGAAA
ncbi:MAG: hypothetical protein ACYTGC_20790, partial [Planctomycetota bacterium]